MVKKVRSVAPMRCHRDLIQIVNFVRAKYIMEGKKAPSCSKITQKISKKINKESLLHEIMVEI